MLAEVQAEVERRPADTAFVLLLDFDGTLAEFNPDPGCARADAGALRAAAADRASIPPSRSASSAAGASTICGAARGFPITSITPGLHGLEIEIDGTRTTHPDLACAIERMRRDGRMPAQAARRVSRRLHRGQGRERGGARAAAAERHARPRVFARADVLAVPWIAKNYVRRLEGNAVVEFLPNINGHKGDATKWIVADVETKLQRPAWVAYIGDDITDEDAFRAITMGIGVLVGLRPTSATHKLDGIADVDRFLRWLASR